jgi:hypothetical protein
MPSWFRCLHWVSHPQIHSIQKKSANKKHLTFKLILQCRITIKAITVKQVIIRQPKISIISPPIKKYRVLSTTIWYHRLSIQKTMKNT